MAALVRSRFGLVLRGIADNEPRVRASGHRVFLHLWAGYTIAGAVAGASGAVLVAGRGYVVPNVSITGEVSFFKVPDKFGEQVNGGGRYLDYDFYGTVNFTNNIGALVGMKSIDVDYFSDLDAGNLNFTGFYFGVVARF